MGYHKELDEYTRFELYQELARREKALYAGICTYCNRSGLTLPACKFPDRHREAGEQMQRLNQAADGRPQVGVNHVGCGKTGCPKTGTHTVVGGLTYQACDDHLTEIQRWVDSE